MKEYISKNSLLYAKIDDKIKFCCSKNKITHTDFFTEPEILKIKRYLNSIKFSNYFFEGISNNSDRKMLFCYPEKLSKELAIQNINSVLKLLRITLSKNQYGTFEYKNYLSAIMKLGIVREKFGDIIVYNEGADIIIQNDNAKYFEENLKLLNRFKKSNIEILDVSEIHESKSNYEELSIIVNSMRIDNFVSELTHYSRNKANELILSERIMINYEIVTKNSKIININDIITIRGFGKYIVQSILKTTKNNKLVLNILHNK